MSLSFKSILPLLCFLALYLFVDRNTSRDGTGGWERNTVYDFFARSKLRPKAKVAIFGSSTSKDWLPESFLAKELKLREGDILDAHLNGCHQDCSWAESRRFVRRKQEFHAIFYGQNLFQWCEQDHSKRALQQSMMLPFRDYGKAFALYFKSQFTLKRTARILGMLFSDAYGDTLVARHAFIKQWLNKDPHQDMQRWIYRSRSPQKEDEFCSYRDEEVAYKTAVADALLDDFEAMSDHVFWILLPDVTYARRDERKDIALAWEKHIALQKELVSRHKKTTLIDLVTDGVHDRKYYRDSIHLNEKGMPLQRALFQERLSEALKDRPIGPKAKE